ncbi:hypothetical protein COCON_G00122670 [Conger conger]|uniref:Heart- and neural crest derivatives-expressed protein 2 n=1 Tax=Conger conger TaxID=82655 RepID=A0A9Q1DI10_CONCO|nr:heart- and neural crest derivatives-expressed protein 2-like [Conger conger]KAJ8269660.1 hypothetical protein COCON_G00122670 [Conger conger]
MSASGGCHHRSVMQYENYSLTPEATASPCREESAHLHGWLVRHTEVSQTNHSMAPSDIPEYATGGPGLEFSRSMNVRGAVTTAVGTIFRPMKRRGKARRKERRRTQNINCAFGELRECIPNVPADTKLSKIKTLRLATSYIAYLMDLLEKDDLNGETDAFKAEFIKTDCKEDKRKKELNEVLKNSENNVDKKTKGRTGWPQYVWALELKN